MSVFCLHYVHIVVCGLLTHSSLTNFGNYLVMCKVYVDQGSINNYTVLVRLCLRYLLTKDCGYLHLGQIKHGTAIS